MRQAFGRHIVGKLEQLAQAVAGRHIQAFRERREPGAYLLDGLGREQLAGFAALYANTTGYSNSALGMQALYKNTTGNTNTAAGTNALYSNTTGKSNTVTGVKCIGSQHNRG